MTAGPARPSPVWAAARAAAGLLPLLVGAVVAAPLVLPSLTSRGAPGEDVASAVPVAVDAASADRAGWGVSVWPPPSTAGAPVVPRPPLPPRPQPPARPWAPPPPGLGDPQAPAPLPPIVLGPVQRLNVVVPEGGGAPLPSGSGLPHLLCAGPTTPLASYYIDTSGGAPVVRRWDLSGRIDVYYRYVSRSYVQAGACS